MGRIRVQIVFLFISLFVIPGKLFIPVQMVRRGGDSFLSLVGKHIHIYAAFNYVKEDSNPNDKYIISERAL